MISALWDWKTLSCNFFKWCHSFDSKMNPEKRATVYFKACFLCSSLPNNFILIIILSKRNEAKQKWEDQVHICVYTHTNTHLSLMCCIQFQEIVEKHGGKSWKVNRKSHRLHLYMYKYKYKCRQISKSNYLNDSFRIILLSEKIYYNSSGNCPRRQIHKSRKTGYFHPFLSM